MFSLGHTILNFPPCSHAPKHPCSFSSHAPMGSSLPAPQVPCSEFHVTCIIDDPVPSAVLFHSALALVKRASLLTFSIAHCLLPIACPLPITNNELRVTAFPLWTLDVGLWTSDDSAAEIYYRFCRVIGPRLQHHMTRIQNLYLHIRPA